MSRRWTRRCFLTCTGAAAAGAAIPAVWVNAVAGAQSQKPRVIVIGADGMDPRLCERLMDAGELPALASLRDRDGYRRLGTSIPPQSPVAWGNFITGAGPGVHGIFDFIHRDPTKQCATYYSAATTRVGHDGWDVGAYRIPLTFWPFNHEPTRTVLLRRGTPFWDYLDEAGVPVWLYDIPCNYPPSPSRHGHVRCLSGMGTPDLLGDYGKYQYFSEDTFIPMEEAGGLRKPLLFADNHAATRLIGPENTALKTPRHTEVALGIYRHPTDASARIDVQGRAILLREGEWSDWHRVQFEMGMPPFLPKAKISGICRFYLQQVRPVFKLYVTPLNLDPSDPGGQRISEPPGFISEIADELGLFYTTGFQEDHNALSNGVFTDDEFKEQAAHVLDERMNLLRYALDRYDDGFLFFYFSSTDMQAHMFWWDSDEPHPVRPADEAAKYHQVIVDTYKQIDHVTADLLKRYGSDTTILVMSDHGFANFRREFSLNTWLRDEGYIQPVYCRSLFVNPPDPGAIDWSRTRAYGLGINGLYLNLKGRERDGIVSENQRSDLLDEIKAKLLAVRDPSNGELVISQVDRTDEVYRGPCVSLAPDLIVGYCRGYRGSWETTLGDMGPDVFKDNESAWSADHCMASREVPGVVFSNQPIAHAAPSLVDLAPTILAKFGIAAPMEMTGSDLFSAAGGGGAGG